MSSGMTVHRKDLPKIGLSDIKDGTARTQVGALCWRIEKKKLQVLLVTSRDTARWVIPKGWPMKGKSGAEAAQIEAWEEAGAEGKIKEACIGLYAYNKSLGPGEDVSCVVSIYPMKVTSLSDKFPEANERKRRWFTAKKAAIRVDEPELREILLTFDPKS